MSVPKALREAVRTALNSDIVSEAAIGGGDISHAVLLEMADRRQALLKWRSGAAAGMFSAEGRGLRLLRQTETLRIPEVFAHSEATVGHPAFIVMEWLGRGSKSAEAAQDLGKRLAQMHQSTANLYGLDHDNFIGANPQVNQQSNNWVDFFRDQRLGVQIELAGRNGYLHRDRARLFDRLLQRLGEWLPPAPPASLLHGDLWGGNWLTTTAGEPALIDPAVYYGDRETDLAFTELFGGFPATFYAAYRQSWSLDPGYEARKDLYNLYHLTNHLNLFGEGYASSVDSVLRRFT